MEHNSITTYRPSSDGEVERKNRTIEQVLKTYCNYYQNNWEENLPIAEFPINSSLQKSTGMSPFKVINGYKPKSPADILLRLGERTNSKTSINEFIDIQKNIIKIIKDNLNIVQENMTIRENRNR